MDSKLTAKTAKALLAVSLGLLTTFLVACSSGSNRLVPVDDADSLKAELDQVASLSSSGKCRDAATAVAQARERVNALPSTLSQRLRTRLESGIANLAAVLSDECVQSNTTTTTQTDTTATETTTTDTTTGTTTTDTTTTTTTPTQMTDTTPTTPTETVTAPTTPTTTTPPPDNGGTPVPQSGGGVTPDGDLR